MDWERNDAFAAAKAAKKLAYIKKAHTLTNLHEMQENQVRSLGSKYLLEKGMATHCGILAWRIPWTEEPGGLQSMGWERVSHTETLHFHFQKFWAACAQNSELHMQCRRPELDSWVRKNPWRREWLPTAIFFSEEFHGTLEGCSPWGGKDSDTGLSN